LWQLPQLDRRDVKLSARQEGGFPDRAIKKGARSMGKQIGIFLTAFAILVSAGPATAQDPGKIRKIGFLSTFSESDPGSRTWHKAFRQGLRDHGWVVGKNISIDHRWVRDRRQCKIAGRRACLPVLVDELLGLDVELIVVHGGLPAKVIQRKNKSIPVVMAEASDAVGRGVIKSLARPGGSITGLTSITPLLGAKRLELLKEIVPGLSRVAVLWTPEAPASTYDWKKIQDPAQRLGLRLYSMKLPQSVDLGRAFQEVAISGVGALIATSAITSVFGEKLIAGLVVKTGLPAIFPNENEVRLGVLMSYNRVTKDLYRRSASYVYKILKGAKPADLPVEQPTTFDMVVNLKTAKALGVTIPRSILLRADEVIE
jgi:putative ABC transport system substrate-binding protein